MGGVQGSAQVRLQLGRRLTLEAGKPERATARPVFVLCRHAVGKALHLRDLREGPSRRRRQPQQLARRQVLEWICPAIGPHPLDPCPQGGRGGHQSAPQLGGVLRLAACDVRTGVVELLAPAPIALGVPGADAFLQPSQAEAGRVRGSLARDWRAPGPARAALPGRLASSPSGAGSIPPFDGTLRRGFSLPVIEATV